MENEQTKRREISQLMREAASIFSRQQGPELDPALPKMREAVILAETLEDKTPLLICQANLAYMNAVCGRVADALDTIEQAVVVASEADGDVATPIRNFAYTKFVEISVLLGQNHDRALTTARALVQSAAEEEESYQQFLAALHNLAVVCYDLLQLPDWALAILSWISDEAVPDDHAIAKQSRRLARKISRQYPEPARTQWLSEIESNRDFFLLQATAGYLPDYAPQPPVPNAETE